jgi:signal peptidase I
MARAFRITIGIVGFFAFAAVWHYFAPTQIGGSSSYMIIRGMSMEPSIHRGDLVILKKRGDYEVGDVAAYHNKVIGGIVLHRIVGRDGERYILRGDNAQAPDSEQPLKSAFVGARWIQLKGMGAWLDRAREPKNSALLAGLAVLLAGGGVGAAQTRRRRRPKTTTPPLPRRGRPTSAGPTPAAAIVAVSILAGGAALLALAAFTHPKTQQISVDNLWQQRGLFAYEASTQPGIAYPNGHVSTGQPVFLKLVKRLQVSFDYKASSREALALAGKASLTATVKAGNGWTRQIALKPEQSFSSSHVKLTGTLDLASLRSLISQLQEVTGVPLDSAQVVLAPLVTSKGTVAGEQLEGSFAPTLTFTLDDNQLSIETIGPSGALTNNTPLQTQTESGIKSEPASLSLKVFEPSVGQARFISLGLLGLCALVASLLWLRVRTRPEADEPTEIERRYGQLLVPVSSVQADWCDPVEVESIEALVHLAERYDRAILHVIADHVHHYMVEEEGSVYRYVAFDGELLRVDSQKLISSYSSGYQPATPASPPAQAQSVPGSIAPGAPQGVPAQPGTVPSPPEESPGSWPSPSVHP